MYVAVRTIDKLTYLLTYLLILMCVAVRSIEELTYLLTYLLTYTDVGGC